MTPEQKAKQLVDKFHKYVWRRIHLRDEGQELEYAKECARICVDEILEGLTIGNFATSFVGALEYWQSVKEEIKKVCLHKTT